MSPLLNYTCRPPESRSRRAVSTFWTAALAPRSETNFSSISEVDSLQTSAEDMLHYLYGVVTDIVGHRGWRNAVMGLLADKFAALPTPNHFYACQVCRSRFHDY